MFEKYFYSLSLEEKIIVLFRAYSTQYIPIMRQWAAGYGAYSIGVAGTVLHSTKKNPIFFIDIVHTACTVRKIWKGRTDGY